jgi:uncharacterized low-complexity protein
MSSKTSLKPLAAAIGATLVASLAGVTVANADQNPFGLTQLSSGYMVADMAEGKCGGKTGAGDKTMEGKCGEGKMEGKKMEGKCGEGKCGGDKKMEGKGKEGKCGEGKCGGKK